MAFYFSAAFFFAGQSGMVILPIWLSGAFAIICFIAGLYCLVVIAFGKVKGVKQGKAIIDKPQNGIHANFNITIDSKDFVDMDTEKVKTIFDGIERIKGTKQLAQEGKHGQTEETTKD